MLKASIIIATRNRAESLPKMLDSLLAQELGTGTDFELILVDNDSTDETPSLIRSYESKFPGRLHYFLETQRGKASALNKGIENSKGDILVFTDDDVLVDRRWLSSILECIEKYHCDGVGGRIQPLYSPETPGWVKDNARLLLGPLVSYDHGSETKMYVKPMVEFFGANFAFKRNVFKECGPFRTDIGPGCSVQGEDTELVNRVYKAGKKLYYCGPALVRHPTGNRITLRYIAQWNMALGRYRVLVDEGGKVDPSIKFILGVPRYLVREIFNRSGRALMNIFDRGQFLEQWIELSISVGKAAQIRSIRQGIQSKPRTALTSG